MSARKNQPLKSIANSGTNLANLQQQTTNTGGALQPPTRRKMDMDGTVSRLRKMRQTAVHRRMFQSAAFIGDKIVSLTKNNTDIIELAQIYFENGAADRAERLLLDYKLANLDPYCSYLLAQCRVQMNRYQDALKVLGEDSIKEIPPNHRDEPISIYASIYYLRGFIYLQLSNHIKAKKQFIEALKCDARCFEAFEMLTRYHMLNAKEEMELLHQLSFNAHFKDDGEFFLHLYTTRLSKYNTERLQTALTALRQDYGLADNADLLEAEAERLYILSQFEDCLAITSRILDIEPYKSTTLPTHIAALNEMGKQNELFLLGHELVQKFPADSVTWFAVGTYYLGIGRIAEARNYFKKSTEIDRRFGYGWIGFAHCFALENEHENAMEAYSNATKLFDGLHQPIMYTGKQHIEQGNLSIAKEYFESAYKICGGLDPNLVNEMGVCAYEMGSYDEAIKKFEEALGLMEKNKAAKFDHSVIKESVLRNMGHTYRKKGQMKEAREYFQKVLAINPKNANALSGIAFTHHVEKSMDSAIYFYHQSLAIEPDDAFAAEMLAKAMEELPKIQSGLMFKDLGAKLSEVNDADLQDQFLALLQKKAMAVTESSSSIPPATSTTNVATTNASRSPGRHANFGNNKGKGKIANLTSMIPSTQSEDIASDHMDLSFDDDAIERATRTNTDSLFAQPTPSAPATMAQNPRLQGLQSEGPVTRSRRTRNVTATPTMAGGRVSSLTTRSGGSQPPSSAGDNHNTGRLLFGATNMGGRRAGSEAPMQAGSSQASPATDDTDGDLFASTGLRRLRRRGNVGRFSGMGPGSSSLGARPEQFLETETREVEEEDDGSDMDLE